MANFIQKGEVVDYTNDGSNVVKYGDIVAGTDKIFVAAEEIAPGATGGVYAEGVFEIKAETTAAFTFGQKVYYDATNKVATATSTSNKQIGIAVAAKAEAADVALVKLA